MKPAWKRESSYRIEIFECKNKKLGTAYFSKLYLPPTESEGYKTADEAKRDAIKTIKKLAGKRTSNLEIYLLTEKGKALASPFFRLLRDGKLIDYMNQARKKAPRKGSKKYPNWFSVSV
jgi:hypothetical protein